MASLLPARAPRTPRTPRTLRRAEEKGAVQQLLGMKGAGETDDTPLWKRLGKKDLGKAGKNGKNVGKNILTFKEPLVY